MDAVLGSGCVNEVCNALKSQSSDDAVACAGGYKSQVLGENVGRAGECKYSYRSVANCCSETNALPTGLTALPGDVMVM